MKVLELFCGTKSFAKIAREFGHTTFTIDFDDQFNPDLCIDVLKLDIKDIPFIPDIIWCSPPCQCFSVATIGRNWDKDTKSPKNEKTLQALNILEKTIDLLEQLKPKYWFIENPRAMMRTLSIMYKFHRNTVTYCQYGEKYMKPTDIWTNCYSWKPRPACKNGGSCHESAPRGSKSGVQGLKNAALRGIVPSELCFEILNYIKLIEGGEPL